tara:strand:- start:238 stop:492 length:255 start_codon:yes stop_codon:yes gene_type:complete
MVSNNDGFFVEEESTVNNNKGVEYQFRVSELCVFNLRYDADSQFNFGTVLSENQMIVLKEQAMEFSGASFDEIEFVNASEILLS